VTGDITSMVMYAGQGVGLITEIMPAGEVVKRLVAEAKHIIREAFWLSVKLFVNCKRTYPNDAWSICK
jgi:hypothetical protein